MPSTLLVTGATGLLGRKTVQQARGGYDVIALRRQDVDIRDAAGVLRVLGEAKPDAIVHTAAMTDVDGCEIRHEEAWETNLLATGHLLRAAMEAGAYLVLLSTDYVFSGEEGPYRESDPPGPALSVYGRTKLAAEELVLDRLPGAGVARASLLYGYEAGTRPNFVTWLVEHLRQGRKATVVTDQIGSPTLADNLAQMVLAMVAHRTAGVVHAAGPEWVTRYEYALRVARCFGLEERLIQAGKTKDLKQAAKRPRHSGLIIERVQKELGIRPVGLDEGLALVRGQMVLGG